MIIIETPFMAECYNVLGYYRAGNDEAMQMALDAEYEAQDDERRKAEDEADKASWEAERR
jgi:hypothetical protein